MQQLWATNQYKMAASWLAVFEDTPAAEEAFMARQYATDISKVAEAGRMQYALPLFVNACIVQPEDRQPGDLPQWRTKGTFA